MSGNIDLSDGQLASLLEAIAAVPSPVPWIVAPIRSLRVILLCDDREEATTLLLEAIASEAGIVVASGSTFATASGRELVGCLVRPTSSDLKIAADSLRASYALAIDTGSNEPPI